MDWKHDQGYKEPKECGFCESFLGDPRHEDGACMRGGPEDDSTVTDFTGVTNYDVEVLAWAREHRCHKRGSCRHFIRRES